MEDNIFDKDFDIKKYTQKRILEIENLNDRILYKDIIEKMFIELYDYHTINYEKLGKKLLREAREDENDYSIYIGLMEGEKFDTTDMFLYPILEEDIRKINKEEIIEEIKNNEKTFIYNVYFKDSYTNVINLRNENKRFKGIIKTTEGEFDATFRLEFNNKYLEKIKGLHNIFIKNSKVWSSICTAYLQRMFGVYIEKVEEIKGEFLSVSVDFLEYGEKIKQNLFPVWNMSVIEKKTSSYPIPAKDKINYEHRVFEKQLTPNCTYLICNQDIYINDMHKNDINEDLIIISGAEKPVDWVLYEIHKNEKNKEYKYELLSNYYKKTFSSDLLNMYKQSIKTKAEVVRFIEAFPFKERLRYEDLTIEDKYENNQNSYNMDEFILDEIRKKENKKTMFLNFSDLGKQDYLNIDIASFLATQVGKMFPEYNCIAKIT